MVSTVFLGIDYDFAGKGLPVLWETMIFGGEHDGYLQRYISRQDAVAGHMEALKLVEAWSLEIAELKRMLALQPTQERK